jgi:hypothetical protein
MWKNLEIGGRKRGRQHHKKGGRRATAGHRPWRRPPVLSVLPNFLFFIFYFFGFIRNFLAF